MASHFPAQLHQINTWDHTASADVAHRVSVFTLTSIAARIEFLSGQLDELNPQLLALLPHQHPAGPALLAEPGVGPVVAAQLLISWSHRSQVRNEAAFASLAGVAPLEASSGLHMQHRLNRGGDRGFGTGPCTPSRSPGCGATPKPAPMKPAAAPKAKATATSGAPSSAPWPAGSTAASKPPPSPRRPAQPLTNIGASNGLLRQYFPKGTDLSVHSPQRLREVAHELNGRPRKTLGLITPAEAMQRLILNPDKPIVATTA